MSNTLEQNKKLVLEAFDTLFNQRDYVAAEKFWSPEYIQHSAHIEPGREGLFNLIRSLPPTLKYEAGLVIAEGEFVILHGRFSGFGMSSRTKLLRCSQRAGRPCSATTSQLESRRISTEFPA
jgi:predicted SnoaL-like aldol condensation-catalyzing enzyme